MNTCPSLAVVERLFLADGTGAPLQARLRLSLRAGEGVVGDRHAGRTDWPGQNLTLVEAEEIERFCHTSARPIDLALTRRNIVTRGICLNALVGRRFRIGDCLLYGVERCEPCRSLGQRLADETFDVPAIIQYWTGRGGLRADVLSDGAIRAGDKLEIVDTSGGLA